MDHQSLNQLITDETARAVEILIPNGAGPVSETRLRHVLAGFAMRIEQAARAAALSDLYTAEDVAAVLDIIPRGARAMIARRHARDASFGLRAGRTWLITGAELEQLRQAQRK